MSEYLRFWADNPWVGSFGALIWTWLVWLIVDFAWRVVYRGYRCIQIVARGWPPAHLDADGDWNGEHE